MRKNPVTVVVTGFSVGADGRIRTGDLLITNQLLYQLSYTSIFNWNGSVALISAVAMITHFSASVNLFSAGTSDFPAKH